MPEHFTLSDDDAANKEWVDFLAKEGAVVVRGVITEEEVLKTRELFFDYLESLGDMKRDS